MARFGDMWRANSKNLSMAKSRNINLVMLIYFASGACSLIDEVVWVRLLKLTLGNTVYASSIVVSMFMGGLALGALIMSRYCDCVKKHLRLYALLETLVTISALSLPWLLRLADNVYIWFYRSYAPDPGQLLVMQVAISAIILLVPSMLMGSTLPLLGRFVTALEKEAGHLVGRLYAINTFGAAAGCFLAGFVLIRAFGVMGALYIAAALNLLVAMGGWLLSRCSEITAEQNKKTVATKEHALTKNNGRSARFYLLIIAFFMSGLICIGYELIWMRSIIHLIGGFTYVFSGVLTVYLLGNVIGAAIGSRLVKRLKRPAAGFAATLLILGICGIFYLPVMILWTVKILPAINQMLKPIYLWSPPSKYVIDPLIQSAVLFLLPAILMGIGFPLALQAWTNHMHKVGKSTGTAYGANTIGAVVGGIVTGFFLVPLLGVQMSISILGLTVVWIAAVMRLVFAQTSKTVGRWSFVGLAVFLTIAVVTIPPTLFGIVVAKSPIMPKIELVHVKEGITTTVSVHKDMISLSLYSSGQSVAGDSHVGRGDQKILGHYGVLLNSKTQKALSVGFGSGESTACLAAHDLERTDCVEIAPEIVDVALQYFTHINLGERLHEEINMIYMDAKNYLHLTDNNYDIIMNDSIHPRLFADSASLYTKEYFESARDRLNKNGFLMSWIPTYDMSASVFNSIIGTTMEVFPHVTVWYLTIHPAPLIMLVGSEHQQYFSPEHIKNELLKEAVSNSLKQIDVYNSVDVMSCYICDENDLRKHITEYSTNSDYLPFVEFTTDEETPITEIFRKFVLDIRSDSVYSHIDWTGFSEKEKKKWLADYRRLYNASTYLLRSEGTKDNFEKLKYCVDGLAILPDSPALLWARSEAEEGIFNTAMEIMESDRKDKINNALLTSRKILALYPKSSIAWRLRAEALWRMGDTTKALVCSREAVKLDPRNELSRFALGLMLSRLGKYKQAVVEFEKMLQVVEQNNKTRNLKYLQTLRILVEAYAAAGQFDKAIAASQRAVEIALALGQKTMAEDIGKRLISLKAEKAKGRNPEDL